MSLYSKIIDLQKLSSAWDHVKKNKPAAGVDNVTYEMFDGNKREEIKQLQLELQEHKYQPYPIRNVVIYKGEKSRTIALYSMRDKVVQQSLAQEMNKIFERQFSDSTYAYRSKKSALVALDKIEEECKKGVWKVALKVDIAHFFDSIHWNLLEKMLRRNIVEDDVIELIRQNAITQVLEDTGELVQRPEGIHQGSIIAPVLSNIYLMDFDRWLTMKNIFFIRYSDDMLILGESKTNLLELLKYIQIKLNALGLSINVNKTVCKTLDVGITFLGHSFDKNGKSIPQKAKDNLQERLEMMWLTASLTTEEKLKKAAEIIGGWKQYFSEGKEINSIIEYAALVTIVGNNQLKEMSERRKDLTNIYKDITLYLTNIWRKNGFLDLELFEYEQFYQVDEYTDGKKIIPSTMDELLSQYRKCMIQETKEIDTEIMQIYTDLRNYENAAFWMERIKQSTIPEKNEDAVLSTHQEDSRGDLLTFDKESAGRILKIFAGREDVYSLETLGIGGKRHTEVVLNPLTEELITDHLQGSKTIGTYVQRPNSTVKSIVVDVDISKKVLLQYDRSTPEFKEYLALAATKANEILQFYQNWGLQGYLEYSGCRGYHVWLLFTEWIPTRYANMFSELLERKIKSDPNITIEYFPNKTRLKPGKYGQCIKLPFGRHSRTGEVSYFVNEDGICVRNLNEFMDSLARFQLNAIKKILAANTDYNEQGTRNLEFDDNPLGTLPASVDTVLKNCNLMKYLCLKAKNTGYLSHFERQSILYVFGHLGEEGKEFIHLIMGLTLNYQYQTTEKFINKIPDKPISCVKLRDQYKSITAEYGCNCSFKRSKNCYPSPVLHAISLSTDVVENITIPTSRTLSREKEQTVIDELNIHKKAEELASKILELKKQQRKIDRSVVKVESELSKLYDSHGIDCLEIEMGMLVRRKKEDGYEWLIEI